MNNFNRIINRIKGVSKSIFAHPEPLKNTWPQEKLIEGAMKGYENGHGYYFDINRPELFTEKIIWYKLFYDKEDLVNIVDKYLFKSFIANRLGEGYTIPLYKAWSTIRDLENDWDSLPEEFVMKSTLQSDSKCIKIIHNKSQIKFKTIKKELKGWLDPRNTLINSYCRAYYNATPRILAEQYMSNMDNQLFDYKFYCFDGKPYCLAAICDRFSEQGYSLTYYDTDFNKMDVSTGEHSTREMQKPKHFEQMVQLSKELSKGLPFVRVDFFDTDEKLYVAELTLYPAGGLEPLHPVEFNQKLGRLFQIPMG